MNDSVSRETPSPSAVARRVFSDALPLAERYAALLADDGVVRGLIGPREVPRLWDRHLVNCALLAQAIPADVDVCDIGSGAGLPGLVLAIRRPDLTVTLVEPLLRRTTFLSEAVGELGLSNVEVVRARAEELHGTTEFSLVTSRAVAPLDRLLAWSMPLVRDGGCLLAMKGESAAQELAGALVTLRRFGAGATSVLTLSEEGVERPTTAVRVEATRSGRLGWEAAQASDRTNRTSRKKPRSRRRGR